MMFCFSVIPRWTCGLFLYLPILKNAAVHIIVQMFEFLFSVFGLYTQK